MSLKLKGNGTINHTVLTVEDLLNISNPEENDICVVTDENRGGTFVYRGTESSTNNGGTIFDGWCRQYDGTINVKWFGAVGDGVTDDTTAITNALSLNKTIDGLGLSYKVTSLPTDFSNFKNISFVDDTKAKKVTKDFLDFDIRKVTNTHQYTAWAQDKAYVLDNQIKVWLMETDQHTSGNVKPICYVSDDGGNSFTSGEYLDETLENHTVWSAGIDDTYEYVIVRDDSTSSSYVHTLYKRPIPTVDYQSTNWTITTLSFPTPTWYTPSSPTMVHSFCFDGTGIVVAHHTGDGCGLFRSTDRGSTWTNYDLYISSNGEEATVKYDSVSQRYVGFIRAGDAGNNPKYWISGVNDLSSIGLYTAPTGYFGSETLEDCPIPLIVDNGVVYGVVSYRNGTLEGQEDEKSSVYLIKATISDGDNIWNHADTYRLGHLYHAETGGASALGVGSVVKYEDTIKLYFGNEERTGTASTHNRIANVFQVSIKLKENDGIIDYRTLPYHVPMAKTDLRILPDYRGHLIESRQFVKKGFEDFSDAYKNNIGSYNNGMFIDCGTSTSGFLTIFGDAAFNGIDIQSGTYGSVGLRSNGSTLEFKANGAYKFRYDATYDGLNPNTDNISDIGRAARRWKEIYAVNGTINTSDEREKAFMDGIENAEKQVALELKASIKKFKWNDSIEKKGEAARIHWGVGAQTVKSIFEKHGLVAEDYAILCYDEWEEEVDEDGNITVEAGNRYGIRYEELLCFIIGAV